MKSKTLLAEEVWGEESYFTESKITINEQGTPEEEDDVILFTRLKGDCCWTQTYVKRLGEGTSWSVCRWRTRKE